MSALARGVGCAGLVCLAACGYPHGSGSTNLVDGSYQGTYQLVKGAVPACPDTQWKGTVEIGDFTLDFGYLPGFPLEAPVLPDGTLHAENGLVVLDGKVTAVVDGKVTGMAGGKVPAEHLEFTITTPDCLLRYSGDFIWNHS